MLSPSDTALLGRYFTALGRMARSTSGPQLENLWLFKVPHRTDPEIIEARKNRETWEGDPGAITAQPTRESREVARDGPDVEELRELGKIGRRLKRVREADMLSYSILEAVHSDPGRGWVERTDEGDVGAVIIFTAAGQKLLARSKRATPDLALSNHERLQNCAGLKDTTTKNLMNAARVEAQRLFLRACVCWDSTAEPKERL